MKNQSLRKKCNCNSRLKAIIQIKVSCSPIWFIVMMADLNHSSNICYLLILSYRKYCFLLLKQHTASGLLTFSSCSHTFTSVNRVMSLHFLTHITHCPPQSTFYWHQCTCSQAVSCISFLIHMSQSCWKQQQTTFYEGQSRHKMRELEQAWGKGRTL